MPRTIMAVLLVLFIPATAPGQVLFSGSRPQSRQQADPHAAEGSMQVGYAIITPTSDTTTPLQMFETFGYRAECNTVQTQVLPAAVSTTGLLFSNTSETPLRNVGVAIANPGSTEAKISFTIRRDDGRVAGLATIFVPARWQTAKFVTELFANNPAPPTVITGTLSFTSTVPVAVVGLRFRGETFSTVPVMNVSDPVPVPPRSNGVGGNNAVILPQFAVGGGWSTELVIVNPGTTDLFVRLDLFGPDGSPLNVTLNGLTAATFLNIRILPGGVITMAPRDSNGDSGF